MVSGINQIFQMVSMLFFKLDIKNQGYIEKSDLILVFSQISGKSDDSISVEDIFIVLDSDSDGKVMESEFLSVLSKLQE